MSNVLLTATPLFGHVNPMLGIGRGLRERGHQVTLLTGRSFAAATRAAGLHFVPLPTETDILPNRSPVRRPRVVAGREDILHTFVRPLDAQHQALAGLLESRCVDAVLSDTAFLGAIPLVFRDRGSRPPVFGVSLTPLSLISVDCAPFGSGMAPGSSWITRQRNAQANWLVHHGPLKRLHDRFDASLGDHGIPNATFNYFDLVAAFDLTFHLGLREMEYERREMSTTVQFLGPVRPTRAAWTPPSWWPELDGTRPVVHVTQGTMDNTDLEKLVLPTIRGLAEENVSVVVTTGGPPVDEVYRQLGPRVPDNLRVATFLPYSELLPRVSVMITNGGYGGVHEALRYGVPLVVGGDTEDKPEVAARVAWSGAGRNLRTGRPSPRRVERAVRAVLRDPAYRARAVQLRDRVAEHQDPVVVIADTIEGLGAAGAELDAVEPDIGLRIKQLDTSSSRKATRAA